MRKINVQRMCIKTRNRDAKEKLWKFVVKDGEIVFDKKQNLEGRSFYLTRDIKLVPKKFNINKVTYNFTDELKKDLEKDYE